MEPRHEQDGWKGFLELCAKIGSADELDRCFELFFTVEEKEQLASRYLIVKALLEEKMTQRKIAEMYKVSIAQITRGSNAIKRIDPALKEFLRGALS